MGLSLMTRSPSSTTSMRKTPWVEGWWGPMATSRSSPSPSDSMTGGRFQPSALEPVCAAFVSTPLIQIRIIPQRLKPRLFAAFAAWLKPCPDTNRRSLQYTRQSCAQQRDSKNIPQGLKPRLFAAFAAWLKLCPDTNRRSLQYTRQSCAQQRDSKNIPQRLKPRLFAAFAAWLKPCPDTNRRSLQYTRQSCAQQRDSKNIPQR